MTPCPLEFLMRRLLVAAVVIGLAGCGGSDGTVGSFSQAASNPAALAGAEQLVNTAAATLSSSGEVPATTSNALGSGTVTIDPGTRQLTATVTISDTSASAVQIEAGAPGTRSQPVFALTEASPGSGVWHARLTLTPAQLETLQQGGWNFNVYSQAFPGGEIRGQIVPQVNSNSRSGNSAGTATNGATGNSGLATGNLGQGILIAALGGPQEVSPTTSNATGAGAVLVSGNRLMLAAVTTSGLAANAVTINAAAPGIVGPVLFTLIEATPGSGVWSTRATLTDAQLAALRSGNWYFNATSDAFPSGEIRGQILPPVRATTANGSAPGNGRLTTGTGMPGTGTTGTGTTGIGSSGIGSSGIGSSGIGSSGIGSTGIGSTGIGSSGIGSSGIGSTGIGSTGIGSTGIGSTGIGSSGIGTTGTGSM